MYRLAILNTHPIQYFAPLYRRIAKEPDIDLTVYFCSRQGADEYVDAGFGKLLKWDRPLLEGYNYKFLRNLRHRDAVNGFSSLINPAIVKELRDNHYDALVVNGHNHVTYLLAMVAAKLLRIPVLMRCETHLALNRSALKQVMRKPLMMFLYRHVCSACLPIGSLNEQFYRAHGVTSEKLFRVPYTVDNEFFQQAAGQFSNRIDEVKTELALPLDKPLVLFASKLIPRKRPLDLLKAYEQNRIDGVAAALLFVGAGEQESMLKQYVLERQIPDVHFFGFRNQSELPKFYAVADIFVFPSANEPWGLIVNEVMCSALPIIASEEIGAAADLLRNGENGFTYPSGNISRLGSHLRTLLLDPKLRQRMGRKSRSMIEHWDYEHCVEGIQSALKQIRA